MLEAEQEDLIPLGGGTRAKRNTRSPTFLIEFEMSSRYPDDSLAESVARAIAADLIEQNQLMHRAIIVRIGWPVMYEARWASTKEAAEEIDRPGVKLPYIEFVVLQEEK